MRIYSNLTVEKKQAVWAWAFLAIPIVFFSLIRFYPAFESFGIAFTRWNLLSPPEFIGLDNFRQMAQDPVFWITLKNTFLYLILGTPISLLIAFVVAYYLDQVRFGHGFIRALYFLPHLTTTVAMAWVWRWFYQPMPVGLFNNMLAAVGFDVQPFLRSTSQALPAVLAPAIWAGLGFQVVLFLAGLRAIPSSYYEAARIDGAGRWMILREITLPLLRPTIVFLLVISSIGFLRIFDHVYNMTDNGTGGPLNSTRPLVLNIYDTAFRSFQMGYAAAQTLVLFIILLVISLLQLRLMRGRS
ncbi:carbohydrate ABC transporter permease [Chelatococcus asaccharovorans]|uniref:Carbohydrate ABC transporter membrane protein 1 (CUT1 family) n=1 Tax=Chelatococcus asaccharovorans TaxID=28210 RepID=A0A2V3U9J3_9HYPH|nr:sugar ABC transporter permease [Chelatococcus asaccharovorans]MBS7705217.1 sugar ABC transporter permease [Chelatococcus asaccharovorans]PXW60379.1 carbohydrate ABC transporter membrane protein 1 (CUT1 family) [Chelatococcus asaccharovorans]